MQPEQDNQTSLNKDNKASLMLNIYTSHSQDQHNLHTHLQIFIHIYTSDYYNRNMVFRGVMWYSEQDLIKEGEAKVFFILNALKPDKQGSGNGHLDHHLVLEPVNMNDE